MQIQKQSKLLKNILLSVIMLVGVSSQMEASTYYLSPVGSNHANGLTQSHAWATFAYADSRLQPGDTLLIMDGTYDQKIRVTHSGTKTGGYITYKAQHNFKVILAPSVDTGKSTIEVFSCPGCGGGWDNPVLGYIRFEGLIARSIGENSALWLASADNAPINEMTHHIIVKNCGFFGSAQETNSAVVALGNNLRDTLVEDIFSYGISRKAGSAFGCLRVTVRRAVMRYDYWEGDDYKPNDPRTTFSGYNTQDSIFENMIVVDTAETPAGYDSDRGAFAAAGNETPAALSGSARNKYLGLIVLNNHGNGVECNGGSGDPNENLIFKNIFSWNNMDDGYALNIQGNDSGSSYSYITAGHSFVGLRFDPYPHAPITHESLTHSFAVNNTFGWYYGEGQIDTFEHNTRIGSPEEDDVEAVYAPDISKRLLDPVMVAGYERGATIVNRYVDGVLTSTPLWPWPNEAVIKKHMCDSVDLAIVHRANASDPLFVGRPGWCDTDKTLTAYIWEANGASCPNDICHRDGPGPLRSQLEPMGELALNTGSTTLRLHTETDATCRYATTPHTPYSAMSGRFFQTGAKNHTTFIKGLGNHNIYHYYIRCKDAGSTNASDAEIVFSVGIFVPPHLYWWFLLDE